MTAPLLLILTSLRGLDRRLFFIATFLNPHFFHLKEATPLPLAYGNLRKLRVTPFFLGPRNPRSDTPFPFPGGEGGTSANDRHRTPVFFKQSEKSELTAARACIFTLHGPFVCTPQNPPSHLHHTGGTVSAGFDRHPYYHSLCIRLMLICPLYVRFIVRLSICPRIHSARGGARKVSAARVRTANLLGETNF